MRWGWWICALVAACGGGSPPRPDAAPSAGEDARASAGDTPAAGEDASGASEDAGDIGPDAGARDGGVRWLAFTSRRAGHYDLHVAPFPGGPAQAVTPDPENDFYPDWTPDGEHLVYARREGDRFALRKVHVATASSTPILTRGLISATAPSVSPDGARIAFEGRFSATEQVEIYVVALEGGDPVRLTTNAEIDTAPVWSATGDAIFFTSNRSGTFELYSMDARGGDQTALTTRSRILDRPSADPAGDRLAFMRSGAGNTTELVFFDLARRVATVVPHSADSDGEPRFSRDGRYLMVSSGRFGDSEIAYFDLRQEGPPVRVTMDRAIDGHPALAPR